MVPVPHRNTQGATDAGLLCAGFRHAAGIRRQVANRHGFILCDGLAGDSLADGDGFDNFEHLRRQTDLRGEMEQLLFVIEQMNGAGFGLQTGEDLLERAF